MVTQLVSLGLSMVTQLVVSLQLEVQGMEQWVSPCVSR